jgi:hypothetical protein
MSKEKGQFEDLGIDGEVMLKLFLEEQNKEVRYELTGDRITGLTAVDTVMDIRIPQELQNFSTK